jgi:hypothetical protein
VLRLSPSDRYCSWISLDEEQIDRLVRQPTEGLNVEVTTWLKATPSAVYEQTAKIRGTNKRSG